MTTKLNPKNSRAARIQALSQPLIPVYMFEAVIQCEPMEPVRKEQLLTVLEMSLPVGWSRNGQTFLKQVDVATGDLATSEDEYIQAVKTCAETHLETGELYKLRVSFNSSTISLINNEPPQIVNVIPPPPIIEIPDGYSPEIDPSTAPSPMYEPPAPPDPEPILYDETSVTVNP